MFIGVEPVSNLTSQAMYFLSRFSDVQDKLYDEIVKEFSDEITYERGKKIKAFYWLLSSFLEFKTK